MRGMKVALETEDPNKAKIRYNVFQTLDNLYECYIVLLFYRFTIYTSKNHSAIIENSLY